MTTETLEGVTSRTERRQFHRKQLRAKLEMDWGATVLDGTVRDIGPQGLFVEMTAPLWVGAAFRARLILNPVLPLNCTVVRVEPGTGIALKFEVPEENGRAQLEALLVSLPPV